MNISDDYATARRKAKKAELTSDLSTDTECRPRRQKILTSSSDSEIEDGNKRKKICSLPLPPKMTCKKVPSISDKNIVTSGSLEPVVTEEILSNSSLHSTSNLRPILMDATPNNSSLQSTNHKECKSSSNYISFLKFCNIFLLKPFLGKAG